MLVALFITCIVILMFIIMIHFLCRCTLQEFEEEYDDNLPTVDGVMVEYIQNNDTLIVVDIVDVT